MKGIITVVGRDRVGIIAAVCKFLSDCEINILDISQTIVSGYFNMLMITDFQHSAIKFEDAVSRLAELGREVGVDIKLQHEDIFNTMHRI
jgi:ACT domain-containing protein